MQTADKISLDQMVSQLKNEDISYSRLSKRLYFFYLVFIPVFIVIATLEYIETKDLNVVFWALSITTAFAIFAKLFKSYVNEYGNVDYSKPTIEMLKEAAFRYKPFQPKTILVLIPIILIDMAMIFRVSNRFEILHTQLIFIPLLASAVIVGIIVWYIKYKPIRDNALRLIEELKE